MAIPSTTNTSGQAQAATPPPGPGASAVRQRFDALPQPTKDLILDKYRDWNIDGIDWGDSTYDCFKSDMDALGIEVDRMYFSGFWSQGDGACFEGSVRDWALFLPSLGHNCPALIDHAANYFRFRVEHSGHYYHEHCTRFSAELPMPEGDDDQDFADYYLTHDAGSVHEAVAMALLNKHTEASLEKEFAEAFRDHMRTLYKLLEEEYDYLTSDDAVLDALEANDQLEDAINDAITQEEEHA